MSTEAPDPFGNAAGRWYYVLAKGLCDRGHLVRWLAAYTREAYAARAVACLNHPNLNLTVYPYPTRPWLRRKWETARRPYSYFISDHLGQDLKRELGRSYDVLHLEQTWAGWLGIGVPRALLAIQWLAEVDLADGVPRSLLLRASGALMKRTERRLIARFDTIRVLTPQDSRIVQRLNPAARVFTVPLAVDPTLYRFRTVEPPQPVIGLIGSMGWKPTRTAAIRLLASIWPRVKATVTDAKLLIVGWDARRALAQFLDRPGVTVVEDVAEAEPFFHQLSVLAYPVVNASGMKVKVLEAMAYGVPVVTTNEGIAGIEAMDGVHVAVADDDEAFVRRVVELVQNPEARRSMQLAGRRLVEEQCSPGSVLPRMEALYEQVSHRGAN